MKEKCDQGSHWVNLRNGRPIQERLAKLLHQEAGVPEGPCDLTHVQKFQDFLGPQGYQIIVVCAQNAVILFKDSQYNQSPHKIQLVKTDGHFDGLTSIPAFINAVISVLIVTVVMIMKVLCIIIVLGKIVQVVYGETRSAQTMLLG